MGQPRYMLLPSGRGSVPIRRVKVDEGMRLCDEGKAERVYGRDDNFLYFRLRAPTVDALVPVFVVAESSTSSTVLSKVEAEAAAGLRGLSSTTGMGDWQRDQRYQRCGFDMDLVESSKVKLEAWRPSSVHDVRRSQPRGKRRRKKAA